MSEKKSPPPKKERVSSVSKTPQSASKTEPKSLKRKLFSPGGNSEDEGEKKGGGTPKRRRSLLAGETSPPSTTGGCTSSTSNTPKSGAAAPSSMPMSERQQIALLMKMNAENAQESLSPRPSSPHSPGMSSTKKTPMDKKINKRNERGETPLFQAAIRGDVRQAKRLIRAGADVNQKDYAGWTALHEACNRGRYDVAKALMKAGAHVNVRGLENDTPLHDAVINQHKKLVCLLLRHGADPSQMNDSNKSPMDLCEDEEVMKLLKHEVLASSSADSSSPDEFQYPISPESTGLGSDREEDTLQHSFHSHTSTKEKKYESQDSGSTCSVSSSSNVPHTTSSHSQLTSGSTHSSSSFNLHSTSTNASTSALPSTTFTTASIGLSHHHHLSTSFTPSSSSEHPESRNPLPVTSTLFTGSSSSAPRSSAGLLPGSSSSYRSSQNPPHLSSSAKSNLEKGQSPRLMLKFQHLKDGASSSLKNAYSVTNIGDALPSSPAISESSQESDLCEAGVSILKKTISPSAARLDGIARAKGTALTGISSSSESNVLKASCDISSSSSSLPRKQETGSISHISSSIKSDKKDSFGADSTSSALGSAGSHLNTPQTSHTSPSALGHSPSTAGSSTSVTTASTTAATTHIPVSSTASSASTTSSHSSVTAPTTQSTVTSSTTPRRTFFPSRGAGGSDHLPKYMSSASTPDKKPPLAQDTYAFNDDDEEDFKPTPSKLFMERDVNKSPPKGEKLSPKGDSKSPKSEKDRLSPHLDQSLSRLTVKSEDKHEKKPAAVKLDRDRIDRMKVEKESPRELSQSPKSENGKTVKPDSSRSSPKLATDSNSQSPKSTNGSSGPKVPPLKICLRKPSNGTDKESDVSQDAQDLPYVLNPANAAADPENQSEAAGKTAEQVATSTSTKPNQSSGDKGEEMEVDDVSSSGDDPLSNSSGPAGDSIARRTRNKEREKEREDKDETDSKGGSDNGKEKKDDSETVTGERRMTRSAARSKQQKVDSNGDNDRDSNAGSSKNDSSQPPQTQTTSSQGQQEEYIHPRKRKLRRTADTSNVTAGGNDGGSGANVTSAGATPPLPPPHHVEKPENPYQLYLSIRRQIAGRRSFFSVAQPKAPQGFKDFLMVKGDYVLKGNAASTLSAPKLSPPSTVIGQSRELFLKQEDMRYKLRLQHVIERQKLMLSTEQEILRVHGRGARAQANQSTPISFCSILKDENIYTAQDSETDKEKNVRGRHNARQLLSWIQDVDDKFEKIKEKLLLRHHHEAESLHAVQKLEWEWHIASLNPVEAKNMLTVDDICVPMVQVNDDFDLLPA